MEDLERFERLMSEKRRVDWTEEERAFLEAHIGEVSLAEWQESMEALAGERRELHSSVKQELVADFRQKHALGRNLLSWQVPAYSLVPLAALVFVVAWWLFDRPVEPRTVERLVEVHRVDTVQVARVDTVFVERYIQVPSAEIVAQEPSATAGEREGVSPKNRAISEKHELLDLVVRSD